MNSEMPRATRPKALVVMNSEIFNRGGQPLGVTSLELLKLGTRDQKLLWSRVGLGPGTSTMSWMGTRWNVDWGETGRLYRRLAADLWC